MHRPLNRILVIGDDTDMGMVICESLNATGRFRAEQVEDSRAALEAWSRERYDLLIADYTMSDPHGNQFLSAIRELRGDVPAIILSFNHAIDEDRGKAAAFLTKPFSMSQLLSETTKVLGAGAATVTASAKAGHNPRGG